MFQMVAWICVSWLKKLVWIQPEIIKEKKGSFPNRTTEALTFPLGRRSQKFKIWKESTWKWNASFWSVEFDPTPSEEWFDSLRIPILFPFLSFPFRHHQSQLKAKLVPNSHPFSIEYPHQSTTLAFRVFGFLSLHTIPFFFFLVAW